VLHRRSLLALIVFVLLGLTPLLANAAYKDSFPAQSGFTHAPLGFDDSGAGKQLSGGVVRRGSPTIAEIDGNTANGKEIAIGGNEGRLYVYRSNGNLLWSVNVLPVASCNYSDGDGALQSAPSVGALFGDGVQYVVVGYGSIQPTNCPGGVVAFDGRDGSLKWRYQLTNAGEALHGVITAPALADVDGDGKLEVGFGNFERDMVLLSSSGAKLWRYHNADTVWSTAAFADVDGDQLPDMIIGSDISANPKVKPPTLDGGYVTALRGTDSTVLWRVYYNQTIWSSPAVVDLDGDGIKEVVVGSGCFFAPNVNGHWIKILDIRNGSEIRQLNAAGCISSAPAIGDIDGDGKLEIVATVNGARNNPATPGVVQAWEYTNPTPKWTIDPRNANANANDGNLDVGSPAIADIDGNGSLEVLVSNFTDVAILRGDNGAQLTCRNCGQAATKSLFTFYTLQGTPAVGDIDADGDLEVVVGGGNRQGLTGPGYLYVWTNFAGQLGSPSGSLPHYSAPWPMFHANPAHTGLYNPPALRASTAEIVVLVEPGASARTIRIELKDTAEGAIDWTASKNQSWISLSDTSGTTPDALNVTIDPSGKGLGTYTGSVSLSSSFGSPEIDITLRVVDEVSTIYLPSTRR
jgi:hypothetical protein